MRSINREARFALFRMLGTTAIIDLDVKDDRQSSSISHFMSVSR
jgi:hypothetical protein